MTNIRVELEVPDEYADQQHRTGLTEAGYDELTGALQGLGYAVIDGPELAG